MQKENRQPFAENDGQNTQGHSSTQFISRSYPVGGGYSVQFAFEAGVFHCTWLPAMPTAREYKRKVDEQRYRAARDAFIMGVLKKINPQTTPGSVVVMEVGK
jgi:hypothetical protein